MTKKLLMACGALVAFAALALPVVASASPVLTENGVAVPLKDANGNPTKITATQVGNGKLVNTEGTKTELECTTGSMTGTLTKNNGTEIEGEVTASAFGGTGGQQFTGQEPECTGESGFGNATVTPVVSSKTPWCLRSITNSKGEQKDEFTIVGGTCAGPSSNIKFIMDTTIVNECEYESTGHIVGTYTTNGTSAVLSVVNTVHTGLTETNGFKRIRGSIFCPSSGSLVANFTLETDSAKVEPLTIS